MSNKEITIKNFKEVLNREVKQFGNSGHIALPKRYVGEKIMLIVLEWEW